MTVVGWGYPVARNTAFPVTAEPDTSTTVEADDAPIDSPLAAASAGLSSQTILSFCQTQLTWVTGQMDSILTDQQTANSAATGLANVIAQFQNYAAGIDASKDSGAQQKCAQLELALGTYITNLQQSDPNFPDLGTLISTYNSLVYSGTGPMPAQGSTAAIGYIDPEQYPYTQNGSGPDNTYGQDEMNGYIQSLTGVSNDMASGAQLQMVKLQSLMSEQQTTVELTTNIMQSLGDQSEKVAENIGH